ncbi:MAG TPA: pyridoxal-phosphate dependent enzyme [Desulfosporosinus sp.]
MRKSGRTPLFRARRLEKVLNSGEIFLKLEGANPSGHIYDRIAEVLVKDAVAHGFQQILVDGSEGYIHSVMFFAKLTQLEVKVPLFKQEKWKLSRINEAVLVDLRDKKDTLSLQELRDLAEKGNMYFTCEWDLNTTISHLVLEEMTRECLERMEFKVDTITVQLGYGYTLSSIYSGLIKSWISEELYQLPQLLCDARPLWQDMFNQYVKNTHTVQLETDQSKTRKTALNLPDNHPGMVKNIMKILMETRVEMIDLEESDLKQATSMLREYENVIVSRKEAYAMATFIKKSQQGQLKSGKHLIILNDARSEVEVYEVKSFDEKSKDDFINLIGTWLAPYNDSVAETLDAIEKAMKEGFLLIAKRNGEEQGICIIVNMGFERFISTYHLAYIGVKSGNQGRGVASEMIKRAIEVTDGNLSLHVDLDNKRAKKLYSKMGFEHVYDRMIFKRS